MGESKSERREDIVSYDDEFLATVEGEDGASTSRATGRAFFDLLRDIWNPDYSALANLRLMIGFLNGYLTAERKKADPDVRRVSEGVAVRSLLLDLLGAWKRSGASACSRRALCDRVVEYRSSRLASEGSDPFLSRVKFTERTYLEWIGEFGEYMRNVLSDRVSDVGTCTALDDDIGGGGGADDDDALFDASIFEKRQKEEEGDRMSQYIVRRQDDGVLRTWKTPGESGTLVIRLDVYDMKDVVNKEKRNWWKRAKIRSQFLSSSSRPEKLHRLLNEAATAMSKVAGLTIEERNAAY